MRKEKRENEIEIDEYLRRNFEKCSTVAEQIDTVFQHFYAPVERVNWANTPTHEGIQDAFRALSVLGVPHEDIYNFVENEIDTRRDRLISIFESMVDDPPNPPNVDREINELNRIHENTTATTILKAAMGWFGENIPPNQP